MTQSSVLIAVVVSFVLINASNVTIAEPIALDQERGPTVYEPGDGVTLPRLIKQVKAEYTPEAMRERIQGTVLVGAVVLSDGTVGDVTIVQSLDPKFGLDEQAVNATKQCVFEPGRKDGKPVAVRVTMEHTFTLRG